MRLLLCRNFQCYLCLALNHQIGVSTLPCGSFEGPVMFAWLWKWRFKYPRGEINAEPLVRHSSRLESKVRKWRARHQGRSQRRPRHARQRRYRRASGRSAAMIPRGRRARTSEHGGSAAVDSFSMNIGFWINGYGQEISGAALWRRAGRVTSGAAVGVPALERPA